MPIVYSLCAVLWYNLLICIGALGFNMTIGIVSLILMLIGTNAALRSVNIFDPNLNIPSVFDEYIAENNLLFQPFSSEYVMRLQVFSSNLEIIRDQQLKVGSVMKFGITPFTHLTRDEFREYVNRGIPKIPRPNITEAPQHASAELAALPTSVDWVAAGATTPIKNQGHGSCWTFATTGALESAYFVAYGNLPYPGVFSANGFRGFSEQQLTACTTTTFGCSGGWAESGFVYASQNRGLSSEAAYPYAASTWTSGVTYTCSVPSGIDPTTSPLGSYPFTTVPKTVADLMSAVTKQPVAVTVEAGSAVWQNYVGGVITSSTCGTSINHAVVLVGYGTDPTSGLPYWKIRNSWGTGWGEAGYVRILRDSTNVCGILSQASSYPNIMGNTAPSMLPTSPHIAQSTLNQYITASSASSLSNSGKDAFRLSVVSASLGGLSLPGGVSLSAIGCICTSYAQSSTSSWWVFGAVSGSMTYMVVAGIWLPAGYSNLYINMNSGASPYAVPSNAPLSCAALNQYMWIVGNFPSWALSTGYATSDTTAGISLKSITYFPLGTDIPTAQPVATTPSNVPVRPPTLVPSFKPSIAPTLRPSALPTLRPSPSPSLTPSIIPSPSPSSKPSLAPTNPPTILPSSVSPSLVPTPGPTLGPSKCPSSAPTVGPSSSPTTSLPTMAPSALPLMPPSSPPSLTPSIIPSPSPSSKPSLAPTNPPTILPSSVSPSLVPTPGPTLGPSKCPSSAPTGGPSSSPTTSLPTMAPSMVPIVSPTWNPTGGPSCNPTSIASGSPSNVLPSLSPISFLPTAAPSWASSQNPTGGPSFNPISALPSVMPVHPSYIPTQVPSVSPSSYPTLSPTNMPSISPSIMPFSHAPTLDPMLSPSLLPSDLPINAPTINPSNAPFVLISPSNYPNDLPTSLPSPPSSVIPSPSPSAIPSLTPINLPTLIPSSVYPTTSGTTACPTGSPSLSPTTSLSTVAPSMVPTVSPTWNPTSEPSYLSNPTSTAPSEHPVSSLPTSDSSTNPTVWTSFGPTSMAPAEQTISSSPSLTSTSRSSNRPSYFPSCVPTLDGNTVMPSSNFPTLEVVSHSPSSQSPSIYPSNLRGSTIPSNSPSIYQSSMPTIGSNPPVISPTFTQSSEPSISLSGSPVISPALNSSMPSISPSMPITSTTPSDSPTRAPVGIMASHEPTQMLISTLPPSSTESLIPSYCPSVSPFQSVPSLVPIMVLSVSPSSLQNSDLPTIQPFTQPVSPPPSSIDTVLPSPSPLSSLSPISADSTSPTITYPTSEISTAPTYSPFIPAISTSPSRSTAVPSTSKPSARPSFSPSRVPSTRVPLSVSPITRLPSAAPTQLPTPMPSEEPSLEFISNNPSLMSTVIPSTITPTSQPSESPTVIPTPVTSMPTSTAPSSLPVSVKPTLSPSSRPSLSPTLPAVRVSIFQTINGISFEVYITDIDLYELTIVETISNILMVPIDSIRQFNATSVKPTNVGRALSASSMLGVSYTVVLATAAPSVTATALTNQLVTSCSSGTFIAKLRQTATVTNARALLNATATWVTATSASAPSARPSLASNSGAQPADSGNGLLNVDWSSFPVVISIAAAGVGLIAIAALTTYLCMYTTYCKRRAAPRAKRLSARLPDESEWSSYPIRSSIADPAPLPNKAATHSSSNHTDDASSFQLNPMAGRVKSPIAATFPIVQPGVEMKATQKGQISESHSSGGDKSPPMFGLVKPKKQTPIIDSEWTAYPIPTSPSRSSTNVNSPKASSQSSPQVAGAISYQRNPLAMKSTIKSRPSPADSSSPSRTIMESISSTSSADEIYPGNSQSSNAIEGRHPPPRHLR